MLHMHMAQRNNVSDFGIYWFEGKSYTAHLWQIHQHSAELFGSQLENASFPNVYYSQFILYFTSVV